MMGDDEFRSTGAQEASRRVEIRGEGNVEVAAFGVADAEHLVEKEISRLRPEARVEIVSARRLGDKRIVEEFEIEYRIYLTMDVAGANPARAAFRQAGETFAGSRYERTAWDLVTPPAA